MHNTFNRFVLREYPRYSACAALGTRVTIKSNAMNASITGTLVDFSRRGVQLQTGQRPELANDLAISVHTGHSDVDFTVAGHICWVRSCAEGKWLVGCEFEEELPLQLVPKLAHAGVIERRVDLRKAISLPATARTEPAEPVEVQLEDYSTGGFLLTTSEGIQRGQRFQLRLPGGDEQPLCIEAEAMWQFETDDGFSIGCSFTDYNDAMVLERTVAEYKRPGPMSTSRRLVRKLFPWASLALLLTGVWFGLRELLN